jgi:hypothetical protein
METESGMIDEEVDWERMLGVSRSRKSVSHEGRFCAKEGNHVKVSRQQHGDYELRCV